ncbi:MAG: hypothetical protein C0608_05295 [Deltaproteobacteria bacterium]|nr:MAG: hypothetical protein C0608_05295 [Deltaproteobacteria bacterium]
MPDKKLVLLHGLGVDHRMWNFTRQRLAAEAEIFAPDLPGFGFKEPFEELPTVTAEAYADHVAEQISSTGDKGVALAGYSFGGTIALLTALRHPELVSSLALVCTSACWYSGRGFARPLIRAPFSSVGVLFLGLGMRWAMTRYIRGRRDKETMTDMIKRADRATSAHILNFLADLDLRPRLGELKMPVAVIAGGRDRLAKPRHQLELAKGIKNVELHLEPGLDHYYCVSDPRLLAKRLNDFIER